MSKYFTYDERNSNLTVACLEPNPRLTGMMEEVARKFAETARYTLDTCPDNTERDKALDSILLAKDAAIRALIAVSLQEGED